MWNTDLTDVSLMACRYIFMSLINKRLEGIIDNNNNNKRAFSKGYGVKIFSSVSTVSHNMQTNLNIILFENSSLLSLQLLTNSD
jgi:hypothetical protein